VFGHKQAINCIALSLNHKSYRSVGRSCIFLHISVSDALLVFAIMLVTNMELHICVLNLAVSEIGKVLLLL